MTDAFPYVVIARAAECTGLTVAAIEKKIAAGHWLEGREYRRGPDGRIYVSVKGFAQWVEAGMVSKSGPAPSGSASRSTASSTAGP